MLERKNELFEKYADKVLGWEGKLTSDADDNAVKCLTPQMRANGQKYHTNRGVTYCVYLDRAKALGKSPDYDSFVKMDDDGAKDFMLDSIRSLGVSDLPDAIALSIAEFFWGNEAKPKKYFIASVNELGGNAKTFKEAIEQSKNIDTLKLYDNFNRRKADFFEYLINAPSGKWYKWRNGWRRRIKEFNELVRPYAESNEKENAPVTNVKKGTSLIILLIAGVLIYYIIQMKK